MWSLGLARGPGLEGADEFLEGGLHAIAFVDAGQAWFDPRHGWDVGREHIAVDGGFGLATGEENVRLYVAKDLQRTASDLVLSVRLHRPF